MSRHDRPPSWAWALFSVACMKEAKGQGWVRSHDNKLTGPLAKGMGDRVAGIQRWQGDGVGDRKLPGEGGEWRHVTNSPPSCFYFLFFCLSLLPSSSISLSTFHVSPVISTCHTWTATLFWPWQFKTWAVSGEERWWGGGGLELSLSTCQLTLPLLHQSCLIRFKQSRVSADSLLSGQVWKLPSTMVLLKRWSSVHMQLNPVGENKWTVQQPKGLSSNQKDIVM